MGINGNGRGPDIPIIGQPFQLECWWMNVVLRCTCEKQGLMVLGGVPGAARGACTACGRVVVLRAARPTADGQMHLDIAIEAQPAGTQATM